MNILLSVIKILIPVVVGYIAGVFISYWGSAGVKETELEDGSIWLEPDYRSTDLEKVKSIDKLITVVTASAIVWFIGVCVYEPGFIIVKDLPFLGLAIFIIMAVVGWITVAFEVL